MRPETRGGAPRRVLLVRLGSMGDVIHALPLPHAIKRTFPEWEVDWLVERRWRPLLADNADLACVVEFDTLAWRAAPLARRTMAALRDSFAALRARHYDFALDVQGAWKSAVSARLSGAAYILGFDAPWLREPGASVMYTRRLAPEARHVVDANLALAYAIGARPGPVRFPLPQGNAAELPRDLPQSYAVLNPGAGWGAKQWPAASYGAVCDALAAEFAMGAVLNCGPGEASLAQAVIRACRVARPVTFSGELGALIALLRGAAAMIAPDTGPLHLAAALEVPSIGLFGPTDPARNGPYGAGIALRAPGARTSHKHSAAPESSMRDIEPHAVVEALRSLLQDRAAAGRAGAVCSGPGAPAAVPAGSH